MTSLSKINANYSYLIYLTELPPLVILLTSKLFSPKPAVVLVETVTKYFVEGLRLSSVSESTLELEKTKHSGAVSFV